MVLIFVRCLMKLFFTSPIIMTAVLFAFAQTSNSDKSPSGVLILQQKFSVQTVRSYYMASVPDDDPFANPTTGPKREQSGWGPVRKRFLYQMKIRNTGGREIRVINWAYIFTDSTSQQEVGRHQFLSRVRIRPQEEKMLVGASSLFPTQVVSAETPGKNDPKDHAESVIINCITYADGSVWKRASFTGRCEAR